uniref:Fibronectin type-III domain-containing protein n=1 Tax=Schistocephalus solidus TaxID=70667 RepID=A0A183SBF5_SCHSO
LYAVLLSLTQPEKHLPICSDSPKIPCMPNGWFEQRPKTFTTQFPILYFHIHIPVPGPPTNVSVVLQSPTQVKIQWDPPEVTNGQIANYTALILQPFLFKCSFRGSENASCIIYDMYEGLTYDVFVYACNYAHSNGRGGGCGQNSSIKTFKTWTGCKSPI